MEQEKFDIKPTSLLVGYTTQKHDYNFRAISGELFNFINEVTGHSFQIIPIDEALFILKDPLDQQFEIRFSDSSLTYQEGAIEYEKFKSNSLVVLEKWQNLNNRAKNLKLAGIIRKISLLNLPPKGIFQSRLYDRYIQNMNIGYKKRKVLIHINYLYDKAGKDFNINLTMEEIKEKKYSFDLKVDINKIDSESLGKINIGMVKEIMEFAEKYYESELFSDIGDLQT